MQNILIVDDVIVNRKLIKTILVKSQINIEIFEASSGYEALRMIREKNFSVIILDIMMPDIDGIQVLKEIKSTAKYKDICVIICSAVHDIESVESALALGALDYFTKPLTVEQIRITLPLKVKNALEFYAQNTQLIKYNEMFKEEMQLAEEFQKSMITENFESENIKMYGRYIPCNEIGGDMFVCKQSSSKLWFMIADISGHGVAAAMMSTMLKVIFSSSVIEYTSPNEILEKINSVLYDVFNGPKTPLITAFIGYIEGEALHYANAGQPYPILYRREAGTVEELEQPSFLLGLFGDAQYTTLVTPIKDGDIITLYTDGLQDVGRVHSCNSEISVKEFCEANKSNMASHLEYFIDDMVIFFENQNKNGFDDDVAVMAIKKIRSEKINDDK